MKEIHIQPVLNGFIVKVGCTKVVFTDIISLTAELQRYHRNPEQVEKEYLENAINKRMGPEAPPSELAGRTAMEVIRSNPVPYMTRNVEGTMEP